MLKSGIGMKENISVQVNTKFQNNNKMKVLWVCKPIKVNKITHFNKKITLNTFNDSNSSNS